MKPRRTQAIRFAKTPTGIEGLDEIMRGGLPRGRTTLVVGSPGSGKTVLALQGLVNGARHEGEPGIFVAFEESASRIVANAATFGWDLPGLQRRNLFFLDARPGPDLVASGPFDLHGLLASLGSKVRRMRARRIVFDSLDVLLGLLADPEAARREMERLHEWLLAHELTAVITAKALNAEADPESPGGFIHPHAYLVDCALTLRHAVVSGVSQRSLRVLKYRGSGFSENEAPLVITDTGLEVAGDRMPAEEPPASQRRVSSGVARLDAMLRGGYLRGASVLVTGSPGTAKTTLGGAFAEAACRRGERVLFVTFDSQASEVVRNLASVAIRLDAPRVRPRMSYLTSRSSACSAEAHLLRIKAAARRHRARCVVIDPVSALAKRGNELTAHHVIERLVDWAKAEGVTLFCTSLLANADPQAEATPLQISTIADTWLHLGYVARSGERNRTLTVIKSRGTGHSNQVREMILSDRGVTLADVYTAGGEVLMGTLRSERERAEREQEARTVAEVERKQLEIRLAQTELGNRVRILRRELAIKASELESLRGSEAGRRRRRDAGTSVTRRLRQGDAPAVRGGKRGG